MNSPISTTSEPYNDFAKIIRAELRPEGALEAIFADAIVRLSWRLEQPDTPEDYRNTATVAIRRNAAELRSLQTNRRLKVEHNLDLPGLISAKDVLRYRKTQKLQNEANPKEITTVESSLNADIQHEQQKQLEEITKRTQMPIVKPPEVGRNAPCPCKSGQKYKRCCGHWSKAA
jgi:hypothetical protein